MPRKGETRSFRFELQPNSAGRGGGSSQGHNDSHRRSNHGHGKFTSKPALRLRDDEGGDWLAMDQEDVCSLVPHMPRAAVLAHTNRERARGASVEEAIDSLLQLSLAVAADPVFNPPAALPLAAPLAGTGAGLSASEPPPIAELPDEVLASILTQAGFVGAARLACSSRVCAASVDRWLRGLSVVRVTGPLRRWSDTSIVRLVAKCNGLESLQLDCDSGDDCMLIAC